MPYSVDPHFDDENVTVSDLDVDFGQTGTDTISPWVTPESAWQTHAPVPSTPPVYSPAASRSQTEVVKAVQRALKIKDDGNYGKDTNTALDQWAKSKGLKSFADRGAFMATAHYSELGLTGVTEVPVLVAAQSAWTKRGTHKPGEHEEPGLPPEMQQAGFTERFTRYWWAFAAAAAVGGGLILWRTYKKTKPAALPAAPVKGWW